MTIEQAKQISIIGFLASHGCRPVRVRGIKHWYLSPFRSESKPSFKVNSEMNMWYDFGEGKGGDIISLAQRLYNTDDISSVLKRLDDRSLNTVLLSCKPAAVKRLDAPSLLNICYTKVSHKALLDYSRKRGITDDIISYFCKEVHYELRGKHYFALAFPNVSGGYELRNPHFKGCMGKKDISIYHRIHGNGLPTRCCHIFEGCFDMFSFGVLVNQGALKFPTYGRSDYIVLNSVTNLKRVMGLLDRYDFIFTYMDNDAAGSRATEEIMKHQGSKVLDMWDLYRKYKDLNEYLSKDCL